MKLSTGKIAFPIEFDNGDKQNIYFNPNDPNLSVRMKDFEGKVKERTKDFEEFKLKEDGTVEENAINGIELVERFQQIQNIVYEELDYAFGGEISNVVFKYCSPFAIVDGEYFILQFINAIRPEIEKHVKMASENAQAKMQKHIAKYQR